MKLGRFCARPGRIRGREYLEKPMRAGGFVFATDGHICLKLPDASEVYPEAPFDVNKVFLNFHMVVTHELVRHTLPAPLIVECDDCTNGHVHACPSCKCECPVCEGTFEVPEDIGDTTVEVLGVMIDAKYFRLMLGLKELRVSPAPSMTGRDPISFTFQDEFRDGTGLVMPMQVPLRYHYKSTWAPL